MSRKLFRQEAVDAQREKLLGEVSIARPVASWVFTLVAVAGALALLLFAVRGEYTRRERVEGFLALDAGAARILVPDAGTLSELSVSEGDEVAAGAPIARIKVERGTGSTASTSEAVAREINARRTLLAQEQEQVRQLGGQQVEQLRKRIRDLTAERDQADSEIRLQEQRAASAREQAERYRKLVGDRYVSDIVAQQKRDDVTDQELKVQALKRQRAALDRDLGAARAEEPSIGIRTRTQIEQVSRQISELQQSLAQEEARRETVIRAPIAGTVTNIALSLGQSVSVDTALATVLPRGSGLRAQLLVPTRAIGFIAKGSEVVLRYEAFPFQRFGQYRGEVIDVGRTVWLPGERIGPMMVREPVYRVDVRLDRQDISAGEQRFPLRPGMLASADILLERRTVFEWIFEPVMQLREHLR